MTAGRRGCWPLEDDRPTPAERHLLRHRGRRRSIRQRRRRRLYPGGRRPPTASAEKRAGHLADAGEDAHRHQGAQVHRHPRLFLRPSESSLGASDEPSGRARRPGPARPLRRRRRGRRPAQPGACWKRSPAPQGFAEIVFQFEPIARRLRLRAAGSQPRNWC